MKKLVPYLVIIGLIVFLSFRECTRPGPKQPDADTTIITTIVPGDSIPYEVIIEKKVPVPVYIYTGSTKWRDLPIDTTAILTDYFAFRYYSDTLMNDTSAFILLKSYTTENKLYYQELLFQNRRIKQINTTIINPKADERTKIYLGLGVNFLQDSPGLSGNLLLTTKKKIAASAGYDFTNRMVMAAGYYKISFKRKK